MSIDLKRRSILVQRPEFKIAFNNAWARWEEWEAWVGTDLTSEIKRNKLLEMLVEEMQRG